MLVIKHINEIKPRYTHKYLIKKSRSDFSCVVCCFEVDSPEDCLEDSRAPKRPKTEEVVTI